jgi:hypothetical protein
VEIGSDSPFSQRTMNPQQSARVRLALDILAAHAPSAHQRVLAEATHVEFAPRRCPAGSLACAGASLGRTIFLVEDPLRTEIIDLAGRLFHESLHLWTHPQTGQLFTVPHACRDPRCSHPGERACDPIYSAETSLVAELRRRTGIYKRSANIGGWVAAGAMVAGVALAIAFRR